MSRCMPRCFVERKQITIKKEKYIISDDTILVGDYITDGYRIWLYDDPNDHLVNRKKIIATTNAKFNLPKITIIDESKKVNVVYNVLTDKSLELYVTEENTILIQKNETIFVTSRKLVNV